MEIELTINEQAYFLVGYLTKIAVNSSKENKEYYKGNFLIQPNFPKNHLKQVFTWATNVLMQEELTHEYDELLELAGLSLIQMTKYTRNMDDIGFYYSIGFTSHEVEIKDGKIWIDESAVPETNIAELLEE